MVDAMEPGRLAPCGTEEIKSVVEGALIQKLRNAAQLTELTRDVFSLPELKRAIAEASDLAAKWPLKTSDEKRAVLADVIHRIELEPASLTMQIRRSALARLISGSDAISVTNDVDDVASIVCPMSLRRRGVETRLVLTNEIARARSPDAALLDLVARAQRYLDDLTSGRCATLTEVAAANHTPLSEVSRILPLTFLSPKIVEAIVAGRQPTELTAQRLSRLSDLSASWTDQAVLLN